MSKLRKLFLCLFFVGLLVPINASAARADAVENRKISVAVSQLAGLTQHLLDMRRLAAAGYGNDNTLSAAPADVLQTYSQQNFDPSTQSVAALRKASVETWAAAQRALAQNNDLEK